MHPIIARLLIFAICGMKQHTSWKQKETTTTTNYHSPAKSVAANPVLVKTVRCLPMGDGDMCILRPHEVQRSVGLVQESLFTSKTHN